VDRWTRIVATSSRTWEPGNPEHVAVAERALAAVAVMAALTPGYAGIRMIVVVHGAADGGDMLIDRLARGLGMRTEPHPLYTEDWDRLGRSAGPRRNIAMLDDPRGCDYVLALRRGGLASRGTTQCLSAALARKIPVLTIDYP
jgi:hypothetical protein